MEEIKRGGMEISKMLNTRQRKKRKICGKNVNMT